MTAPTETIRSLAGYLEQWLAHQGSLGRVPGIQAAVRVGEEVVLNTAWGVADVSTGTELTTEHLFRIASHSKTFTGTAISAVNALASSTNARRREFGLQRLTGSTRGQVLRMLAVESVMVAVIGVVLGTFSAIVTVVSFSIGRADTLYPTGPPWVYVGVVSLAVLLTLLASLAPGWRVTRHPPVEAAMAP